MGDITTRCEGSHSHCTPGRC